MRQFTFFVYVEIYLGNAED